LCRRVLCMENLSLAQENIPKSTVCEILEL